MRPAAWLVCVLLLAPAFPAAGQDLAAAAAREKERREKARKGQTFTNDDLDKGVPKASPTPPAGSPDGRPMDSERARRLGGSRAGSPPSQTSPPAPSTPPARSGDCEGPCGDEAAGETGKDEASWRRRAAAAQDAVTRADADVARISGELDNVRRGQSQPLPIDAMRQVPPNALTPPPDADRLTRDLEAAKAAAVKARQAVADLEEEARKAGVPPGWLR